ncbi:hypothetical protein [Kocuria sp. CNJ-770]|uniref:hypothetical protein n=1 Tax=Kocuria sp. CNJ-770 TaxID=1904964 RepID=UPI001300FF1D|nr:hypothetical protein [Kocuria sp. CNJ-770]
MRTRDRRSTRAMAAGIVAVAGLGLAGCNTEGPEEGTDVEDVSEGEVLESSPAPDNNPTAGDTFIGNYDQDFYDESETYAGQEVTLSAEVTETLSTDTFVIAGASGTAVDPLLIVEEQEIPPLDDGQVVQVTGTVAQDFDIAATEDELGIDLEDELYADYEGEPYLMATRGEILEQE